MDAASRTHSDAGILGIPPWLPLLASRPGYEILHVPIHAETKWREADHAPCEQSKSERVCRAMGSFGASGILSKLVLCSERSLMRVLTEFTAHYHAERNHQGKGNLILLPERLGGHGKIECHERLGGLLKYYARAA